MSMEGGFGCSGHRLWRPGAGRQRGFGQAVRRSSGHLPPNNVVLRRRPRRRSRTVQRRVSDAFCGLETGRLKGIWQAVRQSADIFIWIVLLKKSTVFFCPGMTGKLAGGLHTGDGCGIMTAKSSNGILNT